MICVDDCNVTVLFLLLFVRAVLARTVELLLHSSGLIVNVLFQLSLVYLLSPDDLNFCTSLHFIFGSVSNKDPGLQEPSVAMQHNCLNSAFLSLQQLSIQKWFLQPFWMIRLSVLHMLFLLSYDCFLL